MNHSRTRIGYDDIDTPNFLPALSVSADGTPYPEGPTSPVNRWGIRSKVPYESWGPERLAYSPFWEKNGWDVGSYRRRVPKG